MSFRNFKVPYAVEERYSKKVAYFSMEFAVHQPLKIYSGGLGFLAGSHLRSAYELRQNMISIGILWKYGYYDQARNQDQTLQVGWMEKQAAFLEDTGIQFQVIIHEHPVWVKAWYLNPETFNSAPLFLLSTDLPENDYVSQTITHRLYDANVATKVAQFILLGAGGAKLVEELGFNPDLYHLNEAHGLSAGDDIVERLIAGQAFFGNFLGQNLKNGAVFCRCQWRCLASLIDAGDGLLRRRRLIRLCRRALIARRRPLGRLI